MIITDKIAKILNAIATTLQSYLLPEASPSTDLHFALNAADAKAKAQVHEIEYLVSLMVQAMRGQYTELNQFMLDFPRRDNVIDGVEVRRNAKISLQTWVKSKESQAAVSLLNQTVGNAALAILMAYIMHARLDQHKILCFRTLQGSPDFQNLFTKDGNKFSMHYRIPLQILPDAPEIELPDINLTPPADVIVESHLKIDLGAEDSDPDKVCYEFKVKPCNPSFGMQFPGLERFRKQADAASQQKVLCTIEPAPNEDDWMLIARDRLAAKA